MSRNLIELPRKNKRTLGRRKTNRFLVISYEIEFEKNSFF